MENTSFTWENKVVAITGGSRGIGKAIGLEAQSRGAKISVCDINENDLNNVSNEHGFLINNCDEVQQAIRYTIRAAFKDSG